MSLSIAAKEENVDFVEVLVELLNLKNRYSLVYFPNLRVGNSIAMTPIPSNDYKHYMDGSFDKKEAFQISARHEDQMVAYQELLTISNELTKLISLISLNGSFEFNGITITSDASLIAIDEKSFTYSATFVADLYIN